MNDTQELTSGMINNRRYQEEKCISVFRQRWGQFLLVFDGSGAVDITYAGRVCSLKNVGINAVHFAARYPEIFRAAIDDTEQSRAVALARIEELVHLQRSYRDTRS